MRIAHNNRYSSAGTVAMLRTADYLWLSLMRSHGGEILRGTGPRSLFGYHRLATLVERRGRPMRGKAALKARPQFGRLNRHQFPHPGPADVHQRVDEAHVRCERLAALWVLDQPERLEPRGEAGGLEDPVFLHVVG